MLFFSLPVISHERKLIGRQICQILLDVKVNEGPGKWLLRCILKWNHSGAEKIQRPEFLILHLDIKAYQQSFIYEKNEKEWQIAGKGLLESPEESYKYNKDVKKRKLIRSSIFYLLLWRTMSYVRINHTSLKGNFFMWSCQVLSFWSQYHSATQIGLKAFQISWTGVIHFLLP